MKLKTTHCLCVAGSALLGACSDEPLRIPKASIPVTLHGWEQQEQATNVQDWHRMARKIANEMEIRGLLRAAADASDFAMQPAVAQTSFYVHSAQNTPFARELSQALRSEILQRNGMLAISAARAHVIDVGANVVVWGSRSNSDLSRVRSEAVWYASLNSPDRVLMTIREPFYIFHADIHQYVHASDGGQQLVRIARPLRYAQ